MKWLLVGVIITATTAGDLLLSREMKAHGEIDNFHPGRLGRLIRALARRKFLILAVIFMGISFFAFLKLLSIADLSFAVPATAGSYVVETVLAKYILKERVGRRRMAGAWLVAFGVALLGL